MLPVPLVTTLVLESLLTVALGVLLVLYSTVMKDRDEAVTVTLVVGIVLCVVSVIVASFLLFPGMLKQLVARTQLCADY